MNLSSPWVASLNGNNLVRCALVTDLVEKKVVPSFWDAVQKSWSREELEPELAKRPIAADALWESVLAVWTVVLIEILKILWTKPVICTFFAQGFQHDYGGDHV